LTRSLPPDSAWSRQGKAWTTEYELAATAIERADYWGQLATEGRFKKPIPKLPPIEHPDRPSVTDGASSSSNDSQSAARSLSVAEFEEWFSKEVE